jgi:hypothetical protein
MRSLGVRCSYIPNGAVENRVVSVVVSEIPSTVPPIAKILSHERTSKLAIATRAPLGIFLEEFFVSSLIVGKTV